MNDTWHDKLSQWFFQCDHADLDGHLSLLVDGILLVAVIAIAAVAYYVTRTLFVGVTTRLV
ncbi:MAG: hypothetical protein KDB61_14820, partial [Planctomycetes bacterium]|nr:hypothetical protein [Planctomycetota bacterium]